MSTGAWKTELLGGLVIRTTGGKFEPTIIVTGAEAAVWP